MLLIFIFFPSECEEHTDQTAPGDIVEELSRQKAEDVYARYSKTHPSEDIIIIGSDTVIFCNGKIQEKPKIEGDYNNIVGLAIARLYKELKHNQIVI